MIRKLTITPREKWSHGFHYLVLSLKCVLVMRTLLLASPSVSNGGLSFPTENAKLSQVGTNGTRTLSRSVLKFRRRQL